MDAVIAPPGRASLATAGVALAVALGLAAATIASTGNVSRVAAYDNTGVLNLFSPDGRALVTVSHGRPNNSYLVVRDPDTGEALASYFVAYGFTTHLEFDATSERVLMLTDGMVTVMGLHGEVVFQESIGSSRFATLSPDGARVLAVGYGGAWIYDVATGGLVDIIKLEGLEATTAAYTRDGHRLAIGTRSGDVALVDLAARRWLNTYRAHRTAIEQVAMSADGRFGLARATMDNTVSVFDAATGGQLDTMWGNEDDGPIRYAAFATLPGGDGVHVLYQSLAGFVWVFPLAEATGLAMFDPRRPILDTTLGRGGSLVLTGGDPEGIVELWDATVFYDVERVARFGADGKEAVWGSLAPDGVHVATGHVDGVGRLWRYEAQ
jgi:WD40 repeat protein